MGYHYITGMPAPTCKELRAGGKNTSVWARHVGNEKIEIYFFRGAYTVRVRPVDSHRISHEHRTTNGREARALFMNDAIVLLPRE